MNYIYGYFIISLLIIGYLQYSTKFLDEIKDAESTKEAELSLGVGWTAFIIATLLLLTMPIVTLWAMWKSR